MSAESMPVQLSPEEKLAKRKEAFGEQYENAKRFIMLGRGHGEYETKGEVSLNVLFNHFCDRTTGLAVDAIKKSGTIDKELPAYKLATEELDKAQEILTKFEAKTDLEIPRASSGVIKSLKKYLEERNPEELIKLGNNIRGSYSGFMDTMEQLVEKAEESTE